VKKDARLVLPGEYIYLTFTAPKEHMTGTQRLHCVQTVPTRNGLDPDHTEVVLCFSAGPHPDVIAASGSWPVMAVVPGHEVEVVPPKPKFTSTWDVDRQQWAVEIEGTRGTWYS
jgi:hypothetical protein